MDSFICSQRVLSKFPPTFFQPVSHHPMFHISLEFCHWPAPLSYIQKLTGVPNPLKSLRSKSNPSKFSTSKKLFPMQPPVSHLSNVPGVTSYHSSGNGNPLSPGICLAMHFYAGPSTFVCPSKCYQSSTNQCSIHAPCYTLAQHVLFRTFFFDSSLRRSVRIHLTAHASRFKEE